MHVSVKTSNPIPVATYRLQFNSSLNFRKAASLVDYLYQLGISDCYASPILKARPGSTHGYDVTDHSMLNPDLGSEGDFKKFVDRLKAKKLGIIMDVVPNHMCITDPSNKWWTDVLENGPSSPYSKFFDINWYPEKKFLANKVLLPFLGDQYGKILENGEIQIIYCAGTFYAQYYSLRVPIAPKSSVLILEEIKKDLGEQKNSIHTLLSKLNQIIVALHHLPTRSEQDQLLIKKRHQEIEHIRKRIDVLVNEYKSFRIALEKSLKTLNGQKGIPSSFDKLEQLLDDQAYRLSFWRVAADEINYRRFFDINELAAIRVEEPEVFDAVHQLVMDLVKKKVVTGVRIDHVDGLYDPKKYLEELQIRSQAENGHKKQKPFYVVVEKILESGEKLRHDWPVSGTTGYDFLNLLNGLFVNHTNKKAFLNLYQRFTGQQESFYDLLCNSKQMITHVSNASELYVLAAQLERISEQHRWSRDFTFEGLRYALREIISCFPVYRTYIQFNDSKITKEDRLLIQLAVKMSIKRNPTTNPSLFKFIEHVLLKNDPQGLTEDQIKERRIFIMKFQQLTGPIMAKGLEDTAFYRYYPLASLNEVGGYPEKFGTTILEFHQNNIERHQKWPHALLATTTHDTKRSEDVRARLNVLSEIPAPWYRTIRRWATWNKVKKPTVDGRPVPDANEEYLLYQTLVGTWPILPMTESGLKDYVKRIEEYMVKALREAKVHTSWINPNQDYEEGIRIFVRAILRRHSDNRFEKDIKSSVKTIVKAGRLNSLSQVFLKITCPGVPDFYQGTELLNFSLVDPDNRRPVPYQMLRKSLKEAGQVTLRQSKKWIRYLMKRPIKGRIKLFVTNRLLQFRKKFPELFSEGEYIPLQVRGSKKNHVVAFMRHHSQNVAIAISGRFFMNIGDSDKRSFRSDTLKKTYIGVPKKFATGLYRDIFTGNEIRIIKKGGTYQIPVSDVFTHLPVALLEKI